MTKSFKIRYPIIFFIGIILITLVLCFLDLLWFNKISPWHDEVWNLYASSSFLGWKNGIWPGCTQGMCTTLFGWDLPILSGPYHGVIKSIIFIPLVMLGNIDLVRFFNVIIYLIPAFILIRNIYIYGEWGVLLLISAYYLLFPNIFFEAIFDQGQFIFANTMFAICIIGLIGSLKDYRPIKLVFIIFLAALASYEKLTNLPMTLSISVAAFAVLLVRRDFKYAALSTLSAGLVIPYVIYFLNGGIETFQRMTPGVKAGFFSNLSSFYAASVDSILNRSFTLSAIFGVDISNEFPAAIVLIIIFSCILAIFGLTKIQAYCSSRVDRIIFCLVPSFAILIAPLFDGLNRPWHTYQIIPLILIPFGYIALDLKNKNITLVKFITLGILLLSVINLFSQAKNFINKPINFPYDGSLIETASAIKKQHAAYNLVCLDYSVCYSLAFMLGPKYSILSDWSFAPPQDICRNLSALGEKPYYLVAKKMPDKASYYWKNRPPLTEWDNFLTIRSNTFRDKCSGDYISQSNTLNLSYNPGYEVFTNFQY